MKKRLLFIIISVSLLSVKVIDNMAYEYYHPRTLVFETNDQKIKVGSKKEKDDRNMANQPKGSDRLTLEDINKGDSAVLQRLKGVGPSIADKIISYRKKHGGFKRIDSLMNVKGIGKTKLAQIKKQIITKK